MSDIVKLQIKITGSDSFKEVEVSAEKLAKAIAQVKMKSEELQNSLINANQMAQVFEQVSSAVQGLQSAMHELTEAYAVQSAAEARLEQVMRNTMGATNAEIQSIKELTAAQQELGVVGDEVQLSGAQELASYLSKKESLEALIPVMNDMIAQQYGYNATSESAIQIASMMGKVMDGQVKALSRYGYSFTEAQEEILKFGTEEERAATLAEVVESSVGGVNAALAATDYGKIVQANNKMGDLRENIGQRLYPTFNKLVDAIDNRMPDIEDAFQSVAEVFETMATAFEENIDDIKSVIKVLTSGVLTAAGGFGTFSQQLNTSIRQVGNLNSALAVMAGGVAGYELTDAEKLEGQGTSGVGGVLGGVAMGALAGAKAFGVFGAAAGAAAAAVASAFRSIKAEIDAMHDKNENEKNWNDKKNPSYVAPAYYRLFAAVDTDNATFWNTTAMNANYTLLEANSNATTTGLFDNWCDASGNGLDKSYGYDAARTPWRLAQDFYWFGESRAKTMLNKLGAWVSGKSASSVSGAISTSGNMGGTHNNTFVSTLMSSLVANSSYQEKLDEYWGESVSTTNSESNKKYFQKSMEILNGLLVSGNMPNLAAGELDIIIPDPPSSSSQQGGSSGSTQPSSSGSQGTEPQSSGSTQPNPSNGQDANSDQSIEAIGTLAQSTIGLSIHGRVLHIGGANTADVSVFDMQGRPVLALHNVSGNVFMKDIATGSYIVQIRTPNANLTRKISIK